MLMPSDALWINAFGNKDSMMQGEEMPLVYARVTVHDVERHRRCLERHLDFVAMGFAAKSRL
jgi:hypothetical protein